MSRSPVRLARSLLVVGISLAAVAACGSDSKSATTTAAAAATPASSTTASTPDSSSVDTNASDASTVDTSTDGTGTVDTSTDGTGTDGAGSGPAASDSTLVTNDNPFSVETANGRVTLPGQPGKIVSLAPTHTETLFAIGAGAQVVAVDDQSNYPADAAAVKSDLSGYTPSIEAIAGYQPDLVIISDDTAGLSAQLTALGIPVWVGSAADTLDEAYTEIEQLGVLTGHFAEATGLVTDMQTQISAALDGLPESEVPLTYYHELDNTLFSITSNTFLGQIYSLAGLVNIADGVEANSDYPQLNSEFIVSANPDVIFLADTKCCGESPETVAARDGWADIAAVKNGAVISMDDDIASRWGPRVVDYVQAVVAAITSASSVPAG